MKNYLMINRTSNYKELREDKHAVNRISSRVSFYIGILDMSI
jgi:hypothetical protein